MTFSIWPRARWPLLLAAAAAVVGSLVAVVGPLALVPLAALLAGYVIVGFPGVVLAAYLLIPFYKGFAQEFVPVDLTVALAVANCVSLLVGVGRREPIKADALGLSIWMLLSVLMAFGTLYAPNQDLAGETLLRWVTLVAIPLLAVLRVGAAARPLRQLLWALFLFGCLMTVVGLISLAPGQRLVVLGTNSIGVARAALLVPIVALGFIVYYERAWLRAIAVGAIPLALIVALASGSRGPVLALSLLAAGVAAARLKSGRWSLRMMTLVAIIGAAGAISLLLIDLPTISVVRYESLIGGLSADAADRFLDASVGTRLYLYEIAASRFAEQPLYGHGTAAFDAMGLTFGYPHNIILQFLADFGVIGLGVAGTAIAIAVFRPVGSSRESQTLRALMFFFLLNAMVSGDAYADRTVWGLLLLPLLVPLSRLPLRRLQGRADHAALPTRARWRSAAAGNLGVITATDDVLAPGVRPARW